MYKMKSSDIPFCSTIPDGWDTIPNRYLFFNHSKKVGEHSSDYQLLSLTTSGVKEKDINVVGGKVPDSYDNYQTVEPGDIVFCLFDLDCSAVFSGLSNYKGMITSAYNVYGINKERANSHFLEYWFQYVFSNRYYKMFSKSIRYTITNDMFMCLRTPLPPFHIQKQIGLFLDKKCKKVDILIENQAKQIEKLKAYRQSLITEVVTKGINPKVEVKDSGIEWIGKINHSFEVAPIQSLFKIRKDIIGHEPDTVLSITQSGLKIKDISVNSGQMAESYSNYQYVHVGDFAMNHMDLLTGGIGISEYEGVTSPDYRVFEIKDKKLNSKYFLYVFQTYYKNRIFYAFGQGAANMGRWRLPAQNFNSLYIPVAPIEQQNEIVGYLDKQIGIVDKLIDIKTAKIEKLQKYKQSVIYEYVTGKKEVPSA